MNTTNAQTPDALTQEESNVIRLASRIIKEATALGAKRGGTSSISCMRSWGIAILRWHGHEWDWHDNVAVPRDGGAA